MSLYVLPLHILSSILDELCERPVGEADRWTCFCFDFLSFGKCLEPVPAPPSLNMTTSESSFLRL